EGYLLRAIEITDHLGLTINVEEVEDPPVEIAIMFLDELRDVGRMLGGEKRAANPDVGLRVSLERAGESFEGHDTPCCFTLPLTDSGRGERCSGPRARWWGGRHSVSFHLQMTEKVCHCLCLCRFSMKVVAADV